MKPLAPWSRALLVLASLAGPLAVGWLGWVWMNAPQAWTLEPLYTAMDREIARTQPDVVVVGPSFARTDIDPRTLEAALGDPPRAVSVLSENAATGADWYAILKYRVFAQGAKPKLVVLVATMSTLLSDTSHHRDQAATVHTPEPDPVLAARSTPQGQVERLLARRSRMRDDIVEGVRDAALGLIFGAEHQISEGKAVARYATANVFRKERVAGMAAQNRLLPVVEAEVESPLDGAEAEGSLHPERSMLPEILALVEQAGAKLVVLLPPTTTTRGFGQRLSASSEAEVVSYVRGLGIGWLDLRDVAYPSSAYRDGRHMAPQTARQFTALVAENLRTIGALPGEALELARLPPTPSRRGTPDPLPVSPDSIHLGDGCLVRISGPVVLPLLEEALYPTGTGAVSPLSVWLDDKPLVAAARRTELDAGCVGSYTLGQRQIVVSLPEPGVDPARLSVRWRPELPVRAGFGAEQWWVYPGTDLVWTWQEPWAPAGSPIEIQVSGLAIGPGAGPVLRVGDQELPLEGDAAPRFRVDTGRAFSGSLAVPAPEDPLIVTLSSPPDGALWLLRSLSLVVDGEPQEVVAAPRPHTLSFFEEAVSYADPPPDPPETELSRSGKRAFFTLPGEDRVGCSPWLVLEDGLPMAGNDPEPGLGPPKATRRTYLDGDKVVFFPTEPSGCSKGEHTYTLAYREDRACQSMRWLLPGDHLSATLSRSKLNPGIGLLGPPRVLRVSGSANEDLPKDGWVAVHVTRGEETLIEAKLSNRQLSNGKSWTLKPVTMDEGLAPMRLEIEASEDMPAILLDVSLVDG